MRRSQQRLPAFYPLADAYRVLIKYGGDVLCTARKSGEDFRNSGYDDVGDDRQDTVNVNLLEQFIEQLLDGALGGDGCVGSSYDWVRCGSGVGSGCGGLERSESSGVGDMLGLVVGVVLYFFM